MGKSGELLLLLSLFSDLAQWVNLVDGALIVVPAFKKWQVARLSEKFEQNQIQLIEESPEHSGLKWEVRWGVSQIWPKTQFQWFWCILMFTNELFINVLAISSLLGGFG